MLLYVVLSCGNGPSNELDTDVLNIVSMLNLIHTAIKVTVYSVKSYYNLHNK